VHARLDLVDDEWTITDLNSTNGVLVVESDGTETLLDPGAAVRVRGRFILGKVGMSISFEDASS
jgi:pSer/pThr/pTyr-binding forkhead associated (FHA) protein